MLVTTVRRCGMLAALGLAAALLLAAAVLGAAGDWPRAAAQDDHGATAISVGTSHACALLDSGELECWGGNDHGEADVPAGRFVAVSAGEYHSCGLRPQGEIECWGRD